jgi:hypothetical protein
MTLITMVRDPDDRRLVCLAIDRYVAARERASKQQKRGRSVTNGVPPPRESFETFQLPTFQLPSEPMPLLEPEFTSLDLTIFDGAR